MLTPHNPRYTPLVSGLIGNSLSAAVWIMPRMRRKNSSAVYVAALSVNCLVFLVAYSINSLNFQFGFRLYNVPVVCQAFMLLYFMPQYLTQLLVLAFTVDRYIIVCHPLKRQIFCNTRRAVVVRRRVVVFCIFNSSSSSSGAPKFRTDNDRGPFHRFMTKR